MRKSIASIVIGLWLAITALPLLAAADPTAAHACCLTRGAHHCADASRPLDETGIVASCPFHARGGFVPGAIIALPIEQQPSVLVLTTGMARRTAADPATHSTISTSDRAPPVTLS